MPDEPSAIDVALQRQLELVESMATTLESGQPIDCSKEVDALTLEFAKLDISFVQDFIIQQDGADDRYQQLDEDIKQDIDRYFQERMRDAFTGDSW